MLLTSDLVDGDIAPPASQASYAYETIRSDILSGLHAPGKKLKIQDLAGELAVSPGAVREALSRLVPELLVTSRNQRGFAVAPLSIGDLEDLTDLRCEIEAIALRLSLAKGGIEWEASLLASAHRLRLTPIGRNQENWSINPEWVSAHAAFHAALVSAAGSRRLLALHAQLYEQSERYRGLSGHFDSGRDIFNEHDMIVNLALARDVDKLVEATVSHMRTTTRLILEAARNDLL